MLKTKYGYFEKSMKALRALIALATPHCCDGVLMEVRKNPKEGSQKWLPT
jgi:hypothetical protein